MNFGISTQIRRAEPVTVDLLESLRRVGYDQFELFCNRPHLDFHNRSLMRGICRWFQENALPAPSLHLPFVENISPKERIWISVTAPEPRHREAALDEIKRSLELADQIEVAYAVLHIGNPYEAFSPVSFEHAYAAIAQIRAFSGVDVMIENIPNEISTLERIEEFKRVSNLPDIGICYDTGHGLLQAVTPDFKRIGTMHVHDNHGDKDEHLWPFDGTLDWPALIEKLVVANYGGPFMFEVRSEDVSKGEEVKSRLQDLWDEASNSIEEFRMKFKISPTVEHEEME
jgi:sugar phosphate isomerase/epimerase